jgi:hypothetical protein
MWDSDSAGGRWMSEVIQEQVRKVSHGAVSGQSKGSTAAARSRRAIRNVASCLAVNGLLVTPRI